MLTNLNYFSNLQSYLSNAPLLATVQFMVFAIVLYVLVDGCLQAFSRSRATLSPRKISGPLLEELSRLCAGLGLLLTFAGLYSYIASEGPRDRWSLRLALGSSAIGYSAFTLSAVGAVIDAMRRAYRREDTDESVELTSGGTAGGQAHFSVVTSHQKHALPRRKTSQTPTCDRKEPSEDVFETDDDVAGERRYMGGLTDHTDRQSDTHLGSLCGYERRDEFFADYDDPADPDLDEEDWADGFLSEPEPTDPTRRNLPPTGSNGQTGSKQD